MADLTQAIVYLMRKTTLTLEVISSLHPEQFVEIYNETVRQEAIDDYKQSHNAASIMAMIANVNRGKQGKTYKAIDFAGKPPAAAARGASNASTTDIASMVAMASARGLKVPSATISRIEREEQ